MKKKLLCSMVQFVLDIDWLTTKEFCSEHGIPEPCFTVDVKTSADKFLQVDAVKQRLLVQYAKFLNKPLTKEMLTGKTPCFYGFKEVETRGGWHKFNCEKYTIVNDEYGFWLEMYDSVDGKRINRVEDLVGCVLLIDLEQILR